MSPQLPDVLFLAAVEKEMAPLRKLLEAAPLPFRARLRLTGVGKVRTAMETALALREEIPRLVAQVGCAGAYPETGLGLGDVVVSELEILGDEGVEAEGGFLDLQHLGFPTAHAGRHPLYNEIPTTRPRFESWSELLRRVGSRFAVRSGRTVTVSTGTGTDVQARKMRARWEPLAESMEGAAAAVVALEQSCPFLEVRGISNFVGKRERASWDIEGAAEHAAEVALHLVELELSQGANDGPSG